MIKFGGSGHQDKWYDESVKSEGFPENEDEDKADKEFFLLGIGADADVSHDANRVAGGLNERIITTQLKPQTSPEAMWL